METTAGTTVDKQNVIVRQELLSFTLLVPVPGIYCINLFRKIVEENGGR